MLLGALLPSRPRVLAGGRCCRRPGEDENGADFVEAAQLHLGQTTHRLAPAEAFLDALAQPLADGIAEARRDLRRNGGLARLAGLAHRPVDRDMRRDLALLQALDEDLGVVALVGAERGALRQSLAQARRGL